MLHFAPPLPAFAACLTWIVHHQGALVDSARLLGGDKAAMRVGRLIASTTSMTTLTRRFLIDLDWLRGLLAREHDGDPDLDDSFCAVIDPMDPAVAEICLLTEALAAHIIALRAKARAARSRPSLAA